MGSIQEAAMNSFQQQMNEAGEKLGLDLPVSPPVKKTRSRQRRTGKSRSKMWFITRQVLMRNPEASDADIVRAIKKEYDEGISTGVIDEARWIFKRKLESGEIVIEGGRPARLNVVQDLYGKLCESDKTRFNAWISEQPR